MIRYSSLAAYLAHRRVLQREHQKNHAAESPVLEEMNRLVREVLGEEGRYLEEEEPADSAARRHRERAEARLRRALIARGTLAD